MENVLVGSIMMTGIVIAGVSAEKGNRIMMFVGIAMIPGTGLLITPNIILVAIKDNKDWKSRLFKDKHGKSFKGRLHEEDFFYKMEDPSRFHSKVVFGVIREAILNSGGLIILIPFIIIGNILTLMFGMHREQTIDMQDTHSS